MILGTAGHVDHGKTALVKALTGVDTDRLPEEKRRGITIELGFAPLRFSDGSTIGVVDVPGHEAFVRQMLAGATGVDLALLVVAADEGVMPQTREHLAILELLGIRGGVVALTKRDLVDDDWLALVEEDLRALLAGTSLAGAPIVVTSALDGEGLEELRQAIRGAAAGLPARDATDLFRLPVDRAFTIRGTGTVVTGTVWSGQLSRDASVLVLPGGRSWRVRGIEEHGAQVDAAMPGTRAAIALAAAALDDTPRGSVVVTGEGWRESSVLLADAALLESAPKALGPRTRVRFHLGTTEVGARIIVGARVGEPGGDDGEGDGRRVLAPGESAPVRVVLDAPIAARGGDRFVLRGASPAATVGGGVIVDPHPPRARARAWPAGARTPAARLETMIAKARRSGVEEGTLPVRLGVSPRRSGDLVRALGTTVARIAGTLVDAEELRAVSSDLVRAVSAYHSEHPLEPGAPLQSVRSAAGAALPLVEEAVRVEVASGRLEVVGGGALIRRAGWETTLTPAQARLKGELRDLLEGAGREPPETKELERRFGASTASLLRVLEREGHVVQVEGERFYARAALDGLLADIRKAMAGERALTPAELREALGTSRKFLIPLLEYCDRTGVTERRGDGRVLSGRSRGEARIA